MYDDCRNEFTNLGNQINDPETISKIKNIEIQKADTVWLVQALLYGISNSYPLINTMEPKILGMMARMLVKVKESTMKAMLDQSIDFDFIEMMKYTERPVYYIEMYKDDFREASVNEVESGLSELVNIPDKALTVETEKMMNLLTWALTGRYKYYIKAGYSVEYKDNKPVKTDCQLIFEAAHGIREMCDWMDDDENYEKAKLALTRMKKRGKYKYQSVIESEIKEDVSITYITFYLNKNMPYGVKGNLYKCKRLLDERKTQKFAKYSTEDKIVLRKGYKELLEGVKVEAEEEDTEATKELKILCNKVKEGAKEGLVDKKCFCLAVIGTIEKNRYRRCSDKQRAIIIETCNKMGLTKKKEEETRELIDMHGKADDITIGNLSDLLGGGLM